MTRTAFLFFVSFVTSVSFVRSAHGQMVDGPASAGFKRESGTPSSQVPQALREIGFDQRLDEHLPLDTPLRDEQGRAVQLGEYFGRRPVVLVFGGLIVLWPKRRTTVSRRSDDVRARSRLSA